MSLTSSPYRVSLVVVSPTLAVVNHLSWWCFLPLPLVVCCHAVLAAQHGHIHTMVVSSSLGYLSTIPKQVL